MLDSGSFRSGPGVGVGGMNVQGGAPQQPPMFIPQKLGTVMAMSSPAMGAAAGGNGKTVITSAAQIPQVEEQRGPPAPIMIVVPPAAVPKNEMTKVGPSKTKRGECMLPPDPGPCRRDVVRYFFDPARMSCEIFYYGGCGGNENRFTSVKACYDICSKHDSFVKRPRVLSAKKIIRVT